MNLDNILRQLVVRLWHGSERKKTNNGRLPLTFHLLTTNIFTNVKFLSCELQFSLFSRIVLWGGWMRKGCNSLVNAAYRLRIPFKLDFTRFLWICASAKDVLRAENANHQICSKKNENLKLFLFSEIFRWDRRCRKVEWCFQSLFADKRVFEIWLRHHKMTFQSLPQISNWAQQHKILYTIKMLLDFYLLLQMQV